ncbi:MAG TPA: cyclic nucleotide-binding domain-containing protein, partial [Povalibacter sp.]
MNTSRSNSGHDGAGPIQCRSCDLNEICRLSGLIAIESGRRRHSSGALRTVRAGATLLRRGGPAHSLYAVRQGMLKTVRTSVDGDERILALHMPGEVL